LSARVWKGIEPLNLTIYLQSKFVDLSYKIRYVEIVIKKFQKIRSDAEKEFKTIFQKAKKFGVEVGYFTSLPRMIKTQRHRENHPASTRRILQRALFILYLNELLRSLKERFLDIKNTIIAFQCVLLYFSVESNFEDVKPVI